MDLAKRHIPEKYICLALESIDGGDSEALEKEIQKVMSGKDLDCLEYNEKQKIAAKLYRKGFSVSDIRKRIGL